MGKIRTPKPFDAFTLFRWRNQERIRKSSAGALPTWEEHLAWFNRLKPGEAWIYDPYPHNPVGFVQFKASGYWSIYVGEASAPPGTGTEMAIEALSWVFDHGGLEQVKAQVLPDNQASIKFHGKLGFKQMTSQMTSHLEFILTKDTWTSVSLPALNAKSS